MLEVELKDLEKDYRSDEAYKMLRTNIMSFREKKIKYWCLQAVHRVKGKVQCLCLLLNHWHKVEKKYCS